MKIISAAPKLSMMLLLLLVGSTVGTAFAQYSVDIAASKDNTLYEDFAGTLSNGSGSYTFTGRVDLAGNGNLRRALIHFEVDAFVPVEATVTQVTLTLRMTRTVAGPTDVNIHRVFRDWGEGISNAPGQEGAGTAAATGDATWVYTFFFSDTWNNPGGDFEASSSAVQVVAGIGYYDWTGSGLIADVELWRQNPDTNFGWLLIGKEDTLRTAKRFDSRENGTPANRPVLTVGYSLPCPIDQTGDINVSGAITSSDIIALVNYVFKAGDPPVPCEAAADVNCSGTVTSADIIGLVNHVFKGGDPPCDVCTLIPATWTCP